MVFIYRAFHFAFSVTKWCYQPGNNRKRVYHCPCSNRDQDKLKNELLYANLDFKKTALSDKAVLVLLINNGNQ
jgi:hypothetical protein